MLNEENLDDNNSEINDSDVESDTENETTDINKFSNTFLPLSCKDKKTIPIITKFESARIIGIRVQQLSSGATPCVKGEYNTILDIALAEFKTKRMPLIIRRFLPNGTYEDWKIQDFLNI